MVTAVAAEMVALMSASRLAACPVWILFPVALALCRERAQQAWKIYLVQASRGQELVMAMIRWQMAAGRVMIPLVV
jgi:hypothetical protein